MSEATEFEVLQRLVPDLEAEGYDVYIHPNKPLLPQFLRDSSPDAIAIRSDKNLAIEVLSKSPTASSKLERLTALFQNQPNWELRVIWITPSSQRVNLEVQNVTAIQERIDEIRQLASSGHSEPALLMAWATFEALARAMLEKQFVRPQSPGRIIQVLASEGLVTPTEADFLRNLAEKRNRLIHGDLNINVVKDELDSFSGVLGAMLHEVTSLAPGKGGEPTFSP